MQYISPRVDYFKCISEDVQNWGGGDPEIFFEEGEEAGRVLPGLACSPSKPSPRFTFISGDDHMIMITSLTSLPDEASSMLLKLMKLDEKVSNVAKHM